MKVAVIGIGCIAQVHIPSLLHCGQEISPKAYTFVRRIICMRKWFALA